MDDKELIKMKIEEKLDSYELPSFSSLKTNIQGYLLKIEEIQTINNESRQEVEKYKNTKINILTIVNRIGISRQTVYNNREILERYILESQNSFENGNLFNIIDKKDELISSLNEEIKKLEYRDLNEQFYLDKIENLESENKRLTDSNSSINIKNIELNQKIYKLESILRTRSESKVINIKIKE